MDKNVPLLGLHEKDGLQGIVGMPVILFHQGRILAISKKIS